MKAMIIALLVTIGLASADVFVNGYFRSNGTYVESHYRTNPDGIKWNNYSYRW